MLALLLEVAPRQVPEPELPTRVLRQPEHEPAARRRARRRPDRKRVHRLKAHRPVRLDLDPQADPKRARPADRRLVRLPPAARRLRPVARVLPVAPHARELPPVALREVALLLVAQPEGALLPDRLLPPVVQRAVVLPPVAQPEGECLLVERLAAVLRLNRLVPRLSKLGRPRSKPGRPRSRHVRRLRLRTRSSFDSPRKGRVLRRSPFFAFRPAKTSPFFPPTDVYTE